MPLLLLPLLLLPLELLLLSSLLLLDEPLMPPRVAELPMPSSPWLPRSVRLPDELLPPTLPPTLPL
jgi:hypothetical protein